MPPMAKNTIVHKNCSKSSYMPDISPNFAGRKDIRTFRKTPVEKKATIGIRAIMPKIGRAHV